MSHQHPNKWTARVHEYMLASKTAASTVDIEQMFGRPTGSLCIGMHIANGCKDRWFEVVTKDEKPYRYRAIEKAPPKRGPNIVRNQEDTPFAKIGRNAPRWSSVWQYASEVAR